jgi:hypothetical protein
MFPPMDSLSEVGSLKTTMGSICDNRTNFIH